MIGRKVGRYRIASRLGAGGMATVWEARDELLGHTVALKVLAETLSGSPDARARFRHEAEIASRLDHPGIAQVHDSGEEQGLTYLAMARVDGETLDERIERGLLPLEEAIRIGIAVAEALAFAHARGVVHRDVTTRNVMLARDGRVLVLDFGLALAEGMSRVSSSHTMVGTTAFMAPEVLMGCDAEPRSDLYSLGVVLFRSLTGALPFLGDRSEVLAYAALNQPVRRASELRPDLPPAIDELLENLLAREPKDRYADGAALAAALRSLASTPGEAGRRDGADAAEHRGAEAVARADAALYLAVAPIEDRCRDADPSPARREFRREFDASLPALLASPRRVHVVRFDAPAGGSEEDLRHAAGRCGANVLLLTHLSATSEEARVTFEVLEVTRGVRVAGGAAIGSLREPFALEDAVATKLRTALGLGPSLDTTTARAPLHDPGAPERYVQALRYLRRFDLEASVDGAITLLERLLAGGEPQARYETALARAFVAKHALTHQHIWLTRAADAIERAAVKKPGTPDLALARGDLLVARQRPEEALGDYEQALLTGPPIVEVFHGQSQALDALGRSAEAEQACLRAIAAEPDDWRGYQRLGLVLFHHGEYPRAIEAWRRVTELVPDNAATFRNLGSTFHHMDREEEAVQALERSLELRPHGSAFTSLGTVFFYLGRMDEAVAAFERGVALDPADPVMWGNLGDACMADPARRDRGLEALGMAIGLMRPKLERQGATPEDEARFAGWLAGTGQSAEARRAAGRALERDPGNVHSMVVAGKVYAVLGDRDDWIRCLERAVRAGYGTGALDRSPQLRSLKSDPEFQRILRLGGTSAVVVPEAPTGRGGV